MSGMGCGLVGRCFAEGYNVHRTFILTKLAQKVIGFYKLANFVCL